MTSLAAALAALALWWAMPGPRRAGARRRRRVGETTGQLLALVGGCLVGALVQGLVGLLVALAVGSAAVTAWRVGGQALRSRRASLAADEVVHVTQLVAGQLRVGQVPGAALATAARDCVWLERAAATQRIGGDVPRALTEVANQPGHEGIAALARAWELAERTGAPMAELTAQVGERIRAERATHEVVQAELAGPRATARLLAGLPLVGVAMGRVAGGQPLQFLLHTTLGLACLAGGVVLACVGVLWSEQMAHAAEETP